MLEREGGWLGEVLVCLRRDRSGGDPFMQAPDTIRRFGDLNRLLGKIAKDF